MDNLVADPAGMAAYASAEAAVAAEIAGAGAVDVAAITALLTPVFGLIGTEHLIATVMAMTTNVFEMGQLSAVHAGQSALATGAAAGYTAIDADHSGGFHSIGLNL